MRALQLRGSVWHGIGQRRCRPSQFQGAGRCPRVPSSHHQEIVIDTTASQEIVDITGQVRDVVREALVRHGGDAGGLVTCSSKHTTCAVIVNENEHFLKEDIIAYLNQAVPSDKERYKHNDLGRRPATDRDRAAIERNNFGGFSSVEEFMSQEPVNAHAHLQAILCGNSATFGVRDGGLALGSWQSVMFLELDGPRVGRTVSVSVVLG
mmetsp:Transcript_11631/g.32774  ORF Transcript_11631/g.32774 Transcript_11631/m.32774 type:complete len:208 (+) Transcript_11631:161-784(+)